MVQKRHHVLWAKAHLKWTVSKWKSVLWSDESKFDILVENHGRCVLRAKEEGDLPACYQRSVTMAATLMVWGCIRYGQLACFGRHYECWKVLSLLKISAPLVNMIKDGCENVSALLILFIFYFLKIHKNLNFQWMIRNGEFKMGGNIIMK